MDYRAMFDREMLGAFELQNRDVIVTIERVEAGVLTSEGNKKTKKPILYFKGRERKLALNKTNAKMLANMFGNDTRKWVGQAITIYPTTTPFGKEIRECIRIRPQQPQQRQQTEDTKGADQ